MTTQTTVAMRTQNKGKNTKKGKDRGNQVDVVETNQSSETASTLSYPSQTLSTIEALWCNAERLDHDTVRNDSQFRVFHTETSAEYLLLDSGAQLHACPIQYPGQSTVARSSIPWSSPPT